MMSNCCTPPIDSEALSGLPEEMYLYLGSHYDVIWIPDSGVLNIVGSETSPTPRVLTACT